MQRFIHEGYQLQHITIKENETTFKTVFGGPRDSSLMMRAFSPNQARPTTIRGNTSTYYYIFIQTLVSGSHAATKQPYLDVDLEMLFTSPV